jgi:hypothetical protein
LNGWEATLDLFGNPVFAVTEVMQSRQGGLAEVSLPASAVFQTALKLLPNSVSSVVNLIGFFIIHRLYGLPRIFMNDNI